jgi:hypothetical protein
VRGVSVALLCLHQDEGGGVGVAAEPHSTTTDALLIVVSVVVPFTLAMLFFSNMLFKDYELKHKLVQVLRRVAPRALCRWRVRLVATSVV